MTDLSLHYLQTSGKVIDIMMALERVYRVNLSSLSYKKKIQLLDVLVDPKAGVSNLICIMHHDGTGESILS